MLTRRSALATLIGLALASAPQSSAHAQTGPVIEDVEPTSGPPGTVVHVSGRRFAADAVVSIAGQALPVVERLPNRISLQITAGAPSGHVTVTGGNGAVRGPEFRITPPPPAPTIEALEPRKGPPGTRVLLRGKHFSPRLAANVVTLGGRPVVLRSATPQALELTVPEGAKSGPFVVQVAQAGEAKSADFEVLAGPTIEAVSPARAAPFGQLTIRGQGFSTRADENRVYLGNVRLTVKAASERELTVTLPGKLASGELLVDVDGGGRAVSKEPVLVQLPPSVASFSPTSGSPGSVVTVRGTGFGEDPSAIEAKLGETALKVRSAKGTTLELEIAPGAKSERISIRVHGVGPAWSDQPFTVQPAPKPKAK
jgi:hypothetical protein